MCGEWLGKRSISFASLENTKMELDSKDNRLNKHTTTASNCPFNISHRHCRRRKIMKRWTAESTCKKNRQKYGKKHSRLVQKAIFTTNYYPVRCSFIYVCGAESACLPNSHANVYLFCFLFLSLCALLDAIFVYIRFRCESKCVFHT